MTEDTPFALTGKTLVFHESFDSTRTGDPLWRQANLAQAQAEAVESLLLGYTLTLPNTYAFDSHAVLNVVHAVLLARKDVLAALPSKSVHDAGRKRLREAVPLVLTWYGGSEDDDDFLPACARQLRNIYVDRDPTRNRRFILSGWASIDHDKDKRHALADCLLAGDGPSEPPWLDEAEHVDARFMFDALRELVDATKGHTRRAHSAGRGTDLIDFMLEFRRRGAEDGGRSLDVFAERYECEPAVLRELWADVDRELAEEPETDPRKMKLASRSWAHGTVLDGGVISLADRRRELVDTCYNARLADSAHAGDAFLSSVPRATHHAELETINALAGDVVTTVRQRAGVATDKAPPFLSGAFTASGHIPQADEGALREVFRAYWEIVADYERLKIWNGSCRRVDGLLRQRREKTDTAPDGGVRAWQEKVTEAWGDHVDVLAAQLPDVVEDRDDRVLALRRHNVTYEQRLLGEDGTPEPAGTKQAGAVRAAGRYLAILGGDEG